MYILCWNLFKYCVFCRYSYPVYSQPPSLSLFPSPLTHSHATPSSCRHFASIDALIDRSKRPADFVNKVVLPRSPFGEGKRRRCDSLLLLLCYAESGTNIDQRSKRTQFDASLAINTSCSFFSSFCSSAIRRLNSRRFVRHSLYRRPLPPLKCILYRTEEQNVFSLHLVLFRKWKLQWIYENEHNARQTIRCNLRFIGSAKTMHGSDVTTTMTAHSIDGQCCRCVRSHQTTNSKTHPVTLLAFASIRLASLLDDNDIQLRKWINDIHFGFSCTFLFAV